MPSTTPPAPEPPDGAVVARRRAVALAGHTGDPTAATAALGDPAPAVRATALGALARLGALDADTVRASAADPAPEVRRRACEVVAAAARTSGAAPDAVVADPAVVVGLLADPDPSVAEAACFALGELGGAVAGGPAVALLASVAGTHPDPLVREAAVAALGAVGDPAGLDAILDATTDKPAVRRRAVLALAPFEGRRVEAALEAALGDRDWQVRQAAEDLTGEPEAPPARWGPAGGGAPAT